MLVTAQRDDLCLAFANTSMWRGRAEPVETLADLDALLTWAVRHAGLAAEGRCRLEAWASDHRAGSAKLFTEAIGLREAISGTFAALASGGHAADADLALLNRALAEVPRRRLARAGAGYAWSLARQVRPSAAVLLAPVLWSAADLLAASQRRRIRRCANDECLWLFVDESRKGTRRWCDMGACGNRAKARRHYLKSKQA